MQVDLRKKIEALSKVDFTNHSEVEVVMDGLASALVRKYQWDKRGGFWGRTPSLYQVIGALVDKGILPEDAESYSSEIKHLLREAYGDDFEEEQAEELEMQIESLKEILLEKLIE